MKPLSSIVFCFTIVALLSIYEIVAEPASAEVSYRIRRVAIKGVHNVPRKTLRRILETKSAAAWRIWKVPMVITRETIRDDLIRIRRYYRDRGFYQTNVSYTLNGQDPATTPPDSNSVTAESKIEAPDLVDIVFVVTEGNPVKIAGIDLDIVDSADVSRDLRGNDMPIRVGTRFEIEHYQETKRLLSRRLGNMGYPFARIEGDVTINLKEDTANIALSVDPGVQCRFGPVTLTGDTAHVDNVIIQRAIEFSEGDGYSEQLIDASQRNLFNLDVFRPATILPAQEADDEQHVPIQIKLKARKNNSIVLGPGFGNEDGPRIRGTWTYRNLLHRAGKLSLNVKHSDIVDNIEVQFRQPYWLSSKNEVLAKTGFRRDQLVAHETSKLFFTTDFSRRVGRYHRWNIGHTVEASKLEEIDVSDPGELQRFLRDNNFFISALHTGFSFDNRDNELNPRHGTILTLAAEHGSSIYGSEVDYIQTDFDVTRHMPITKSLTVSGRLRAQTIVDTEDTTEIPIFKRLFLGGSTSVRGYGFQKLGPLDSDGNPLGGQTSLNANIELRYPIYGQFAGVFFIDAGSVSQQAFEYESEALRYSIGAGLRYNTLVGPIRLDFGYKLNPPTKGDFGNTTDPDREIEDRWKIHISIGQAF